MFLTNKNLLPCRTSSSLARVSAVLCLAMTLPALGGANELSLKLDVGYDDNPLRLSEQFSPKGSEYLEANLKGELNLSEHFFVNVLAKARRYESDLEDADSSRWKAGVGHRFKNDWLGDRSELETLISAGARNKTYVSRLSGEIGESGGELIENRYDYRFIKLESDLKVRWSKANRSKFYLEVEQRNYEDLEQLGLSNFDYVDVALGGDWRHRFSKQSSMKVGLEKSYRRFDDRRERDVQGNSIEGTDLTYDAWQASLAYTYRIAKQWRFSLSSQYDIRADSGPGYYDWERLLLGASVRYTPDKTNTLRVGVTYSEDRYEQRADNAGIDDEELSEQQGFRYRLGFERTLPWVEGLSVRAHYRYDDIDADRAEYRYDRHQVSLGLGLKF